jgi:hypothetical protein
MRPTHLLLCPAVSIKIQELRLRVRIRSKGRPYCMYSAITAVKTTHAPRPGRACLNGRCSRSKSADLVVHDRARPFAEPRGIITAVLPAAAASVLEISGCITTRILLPGVRIASYSARARMHVCDRPRISRRARDWLLGLPPSWLRRPGYCVRPRAPRVYGAGFCPLNAGSR